MSLYYRTTGFVFKKEDSLEADRNFSVFTKEFGRMEIVGKSIRKISSKLRGGIEVFSVSCLEFIQGKNKKTLTDAVFTQQFNNIFENPEKFKTACKISGMLANLIRGQEKDEELFYLLIETFHKLNICQPPIESLLTHYFFWNFIAVLGHQPQLSHCAVCGQVLQAHHLYFSNKEGGVICKNCATIKKDGVKITSEAVKVLRLIIKKDWDTLTKVKIGASLQESLKKVSREYYQYLRSIY